MSQMIEHKGLLFRIDPKASNRLQYSKNKGVSWMLKMVAPSSMGEFVELLDGGDEILATTTKGLYYSKNTGSSFMPRRR